MELLNQPFAGQLGSRLIELLDSGQFHTLNIVVAFAKNSGVLRISSSMIRFRELGGKINAYVGVDLGGTSYEALTALLMHTDSLSVVHSEAGQSFHPKIYELLGSDKRVIVVGSHNLTGGGLWSNFESSVIVTETSTNRADTQVAGGLTDYIGQLKSLKKSFMPLVVQDDIEKLLRNGYVFKEVFERIERAKVAKSSQTRERLFGNGRPADLPGLAVQQKQISGVGSLAPATATTIPVDDEGLTIWFETRKMTGGSRNILDLSMRSLVSRGDPRGTPFDLGRADLMRGGVEFFGIDPTDTDISKDITLNFEGVDYTGNKILFPTGTNANGTWRIQIKGADAKQRKITDVFKDKGSGYYLVEKIVTFTKIVNDYYSMSVFPESDIDKFRESSRILARNGATNSAKELGLI